MSAFGAKSRLSPYCFHTAHLSSARIGKFISILHQTTTLDYWHLARKLLFPTSILHQTTTSPPRERSLCCCFLFQFYIKPQLSPPGALPMPVVSYFNSTSNHNRTMTSEEIRNVVSYFNSTSNHNYTGVETSPLPLFLISILHQTTTKTGIIRLLNSCFLFQFYIKPQPSDMRFVDCHSVMWPNERYERRMTGRGSRNDAGFVFQRYFSLKVECTSRARNRYMFAK